jgi:hypothetical protein
MDIGFVIFFGYVLCLLDVGYVIFIGCWLCLLLLVTFDGYVLLFFDGYV